MRFFDHCKNLRVHCISCRNDINWRASLLAARLVEERDFKCPYGVEKWTAPFEQANALIEAGYISEASSLFTREVRRGKGTCCGQKN